MILLDTHIVIWLALQPDRLSKRAKAAIRAARIEGGLAIAGISLLELAWLAQKGRVETTLSDGASHYARDRSARGQLPRFVSEGSPGPFDWSHCAG